MTIDANDFFRQATMRICGSLDIETAMWRTLEYLEKFIPITGMNLVLSDPDMTVVETLSQVSRYRVKKIDQKIYFPEKMQGDLKVLWRGLKDVYIINRPQMSLVTQNMSQLLGMHELSTMTLRLKITDKRQFALLTYALGINQYKKEHAQLLSILHDPFAIVMSNALKHKELLELKEMLADDNRYLHQELLRISGDEIIGRDRGLKKVFEMVRQVAPLNVPVLLLGETGVGKEVFANALHYLSPRKNKPFIKVNCGAIPETLIDSELFGHEKGAFTGATTQKRGRFERAHNGTILLDEIGELPQEAQVRLLRVLQNKEIERVGGTEPIPVDIRIIAATHRDLEKMITSNQFRKDLWFRLNVFPINITPLRKRREDIPALVEYFIRRKANEKNIPPPTVPPEAMDLLKAYPWPGNVRELENIVERALIQHQGQNSSAPLSFEGLLFLNPESAPSLPPVQNHEPSEMEKFAMVQQILKILFPQAGFGPLNLLTNNQEIQKLDDAVSLHIQKALKLTGGKIHGPGGAAELLGQNPNTLRSKMKKLGILSNQRKKHVI